MHPQYPDNASSLGNLVVLEQADGIAGRYCGRLLAIQGARVLTAGAAPRTAIPEFDCWLDAGKRQLPAAECWQELERAAPEFRILLAGQSADAVVQADREVAQRQLETLRLGITWFGLDGPYRDWIGDDALIQALIGIADGFGASDGPPMLPQGHAPQFVAGVTLFIGALAAAWGRQHKRPTHRVDVNILEAAMCFTEVAPPMHEQNPGPPAPRAVNRFASNHPTTVYATQDGWIGVTALTPAQWASLADLVGLPEWATDARFSTSAARVQNADLIDAQLGARLKTAPTAHWLMEGQRRRIPLAPVPTHLEAMATAHWRARQSFSAVAGAPGILAPNLPFRLTCTGHAAGRRRAPLESVAARPSESAEARPSATPALPLSDVRVADFSMGWAGPLCTRLLGDLGAEVVKIEAPDHYDWWRGWEPAGASEPPQTEVMAPFLIMNRNKKGICLDLRADADRQTAEHIVADSDFVIENFAPGVMDKLGLGPSRLAAQNPGLVMVSMGAFGASGPWQHFRAYGSTVEHASAMPHANGQQSWPPVLQHGAYGDPVAGLYAAAAALTGLHGRARLGGSWFDLAQVECLFQLGADMFIGAQTRGAPPRLGSASPDMAPRATIRCSDGYLALCCRDERDWQRLCDWAGADDWRQWASVAARNANQAAIAAGLAQRLSNTTTSAAAAALQKAGVPAAPVHPGHCLPEDPHLRRTGAWQRIHRRFVGSHLIAAPVFRLDGDRLAIRTPAPTLGEHGGQFPGPTRPPTAG